MNSKRLLGRLAIAPRSISARLYCVGALAIVTVSSLSLATVHFAGRTEAAAKNFYGFGLVGVVTASELQMLLERHRRIVESAPVELDRLSIDKDRRVSEEIADHITALVEGNQDAYLRTIAAELPTLVAHARRVLFLAANFAQQQALDAVYAYGLVAKRLDDMIAGHRENRLAQADRDVRDLVERGHQLVHWAVAGGLVAFILIGPLSLAIVLRIVTRLKAITNVMRRLARAETEVSVPSTSDADEVGEMARAIEVFKANAIAVLRSRDNIERLNRWLDIALNNMARGLSLFDDKDCLVMCNRRYAEIYAIPPELTVPGTPFSAIIRHCMMAAGNAVPVEPARACEDWLAWHADAIAAGEEITQIHTLADGRLISVNIQPLAGGGWVDVHEDVTAQRHSERRIIELAQVDALTGLANRHHFMDELGKAFKRIPISGEFAILWIDLDHFKLINDTFGHPVGDELLSIVARRLEGAVRRSDFVARLGGDEFAIFASGQAVGPDEVGAMAERILQALAEPWQVSGQELIITASIGVAIAPRDGATPDDLLKNADIALYQAKDQGRGTWELFRPEFESGLRERRQFESELRHAIAAGELELHFQPIVDIRKREVVSVEALMRWRHPVRGMISPAKFIPVAEELRLIVTMGEQVLMEAARTAVSLPAHVKVAVNLSARQFEHADLVAAVDRALDASGLPPERLELEVTESLLIRDEARALEILRRLRERGIGIALDDFGTGYASLSYLRRFPFDKIKIDQSFVRDLPEHADCVAIVRAIADLARTLGMRTVAEGVETQDHLRRVAEAGCDEVQGFYFSRPVAAPTLCTAIADCGVLIADSGVLIADAA